MNPPTSQKEVRQFISLVHYYRDIRARRSHTFVSLTKISSNKVKYKWTKIGQDDFEEIKRIVDRDNLLVYPDFIEEFKFHTDD